MIDLTQDERKRPLFAWALKSVAIIGGLSLLASGWLSSMTRDRDTLSRLATNVSRGVEDPLTTGSVAGRAAGAKLDPCAAPRR